MLLRANFNAHVRLRDRAKVGRRTALLRLVVNPGVIEFLRQDGGGLHRERVTRRKNQAQPHVRARVVHVEQQVGLRVCALRAVNAVQFARTPKLVLLRFKRCVKTDLRKGTVQIKVAITPVEPHGLRVRKHQRNICAGAARAVAFGARHPLLDQANTRPLVPVRPASNDNFAN